MDPLSASSTLSSASRQVTDPSWPAHDVDREMTCWSPATEPGDGNRLALTRLASVVISALRTRLARLAPASSV